MLTSRAEMDLQKAVLEGNLEFIQSVLSNINSQPNSIVQEQLGLLLHDAVSPEVARELLQRGAEVDARNGMRETPLHSAISLKKDPAFVRELLLYDASVHASDYKGSTPLFLALKKENRNLEIVKALLEHGADINTQNRERRQYGGHISSLDISVYDLDCAKLLMKHALIQNLDRDYHTVVDLDPYKGLDNYKKLCNFLEECASEIVRMQNDKLDGNMTLLDFVVSEEECLDNLNVNGKNKNIADEVFERLFGNKFFIYEDVILNKLGCRYLQCKLTSLHNNFVENVALDGYSALNISKFLTNADLLNLIKAFYY